LGGLAGWRGGRADFLVMRMVDVMSAIPTLLFAFLIMARLGAGFWNVMLAIGVTSWISVCRLVRAQFLSLREKEFIEAERMIGASSWRIFRVHLLPNDGADHCGPHPGHPGAIFAEAAEFPRGHQPAHAQLGPDARAGRHHQHDLLLAPGALPGADDRAHHAGPTLMGDGLRDALDPRMINAK
jgi:hypothetical protein